ncbi:WD repeat-containing protein 60 [Thrips palmi]|uniref:WD repeat-containing protein 60 n=1 Tax=Thrips palmi TaxID=161013 RepID=A0A6P9A5L8_THRPL|nr:WD repeat-containing protein 60 [Thrips palmi]
MLFSTALSLAAFQWTSPSRVFSSMSRSKAQISTRDMSKNMTDKTRSSSVSRRESAVSSQKVKASEDVGSKRTATEIKRQKAAESSIDLSKESKSKVPSQRVIAERQPKTSTSKPSSLNQPREATKPASKSRSESNVGNRTRSKELPKPVVTNKPSQAITKTKVKPGAELKSSPRISDQQKGIASQARRNGESKTTVTKSLQPEQNKKKAEAKVMPKSVENGSGEGRLNRERTKTRTLNPEDSQLLTTLQNAAQQLPPDINPQSAETELDYEDDFEDYESDFEEAPSLEVTSEEDTNEEVSKREDGDNEDDDDDKENYDYGDSSSSLSELQTNKDVLSSANGKSGVEEKKMDSGHYDLADDQRLSRKFVGSVVNNNLNVYERENLPLREISSQISVGETTNQSGSFEVKAINFAQAKKRQQERKASSKVKQRGEVLLNMIRLDCVSFPLFEAAPVPYEIYMRSYGRSNAQQVSCQTNEDGMTEEVQTDEIVSINKWTQHPPSLYQPDDSIAHPLLCAVSSDPCDPSDLLLWRKGLQTDVVKLENFILNTGQLMLSVLEEMSSGAQGLLKSNKVDLGFSQGFMTLGTDSVPFLKNRKVSRICFVPHQPNTLLSVHLKPQEVNYSEELSSQLVKRCILCLWSLSQPSQPLKILVSSSDVRACSFHPSRPNLLFAGLVDGLLNVWDLKEQTIFQSKVTYQNTDWGLKSPAYTTVDHIGTKHSSAVVGVEVIDGMKDSPNQTSELSPTQICSLDESGLCIIWTLLSSSAGVTEDVGTAPWSSIRLLQNESFSLVQRVAPAIEDGGENLQFSDLRLDSADSAHLWAATNTGHVAHSLSSGSRAHPAVYLPDWECVSPATCLCPCPFSLPYFLLGCADGTVRLHSRHSARPLLSVAGTGGAVGAGPAIACLQWSTCRPCVFFALDTESRLHVWDLGASDMYPILTVPFRGKTISTMELSPSRHAAKACPFLALGTACGKLKVHLVKDSFASTSLEQTALELDKLKRYMAIL